MGPLLASIPSPHSGAIHLGPLQLRAYGFMIALGVIAAVWLLGRRLGQRALGTKDDAAAIGMWGVLAGVLGARLYHVVTDWQLFEHHLSNIPKVWQGGLGIPGGLIAGVPVGLWAANKRGIGARDIATVAAPVIPLAQAIGRWGNWWNQELFGRPTTLPWALKIDIAHVPAGYLPGTTFHPTFLYESIGNFALCGLLLWIDRRHRPRPGRLMAMYLMGYAALRFGVESLRIDPANKLAGLRVNTWVSMIVFVAAGVWLISDARRAAPDTVAPVGAGNEPGDPVTTAGTPEPVADTPGGLIVDPPEAPGAEALPPD